jgi:hypothetical protein
MFHRRANARLPTAAKATAMIICFMLSRSRRFRMMEFSKQPPARDFIKISAIGRSQPIEGRADYMVCSSSQQIPIDGSASADHWRVSFRVQ